MYGYSLVCVCVCVYLPALLPVFGLFGLVGFDTADVMWRAFHQCVHQIVGLFLFQETERNLLHSCFTYQPIADVHATLKRLLNRERYEMSVRGAVGYKCICKSEWLDVIYLFQSKQVTASYS